MTVFQPPLLSSKPFPSLPDSKRPGSSQHHDLTTANGRDDSHIIDLTKPTVRAVMNMLHGASFPKSEYEVIDLTAE